MDERTEEAKKQTGSIRKICRDRIQYIDEEITAIWKNGRLIITNKNMNTINSICLYSSGWRSILSRVILTERLFRFEPRFVTRFRTGDLLVSLQGKLMRVNIKTLKTSIVFSYTRGTKNPLHFCEYERRGVNEIVFGDYGGHDENGGVGIFRLSQNKVKKIASIPHRMINHIHRVEFDKYRDIYWVFTGDTDTGSGIWKLNYDGTGLVQFLIGSQQYRACMAYVYEDHILYATDSPIDDNHIYKLDLKTKKLHSVYDLPGPCIYGARLSGLGEDFNETVFFATAVEPDSTLPKLRFRLTYKLGKGIRDRYTHLIISDKNGLREIWKSKKDKMPIWLFQFGNIRFPVQRNKNGIYFCPQACVDHGTYTLII